MGAGKVIAIIGASISLASLFLSLILPEWFGWYRASITDGITTVGLYLTGFGNFISTGLFPPLTDIIYLTLIGAFVIIVGAIILIIGAAKEIKAMGIIGGVLTLIGPILLLSSLVVGIYDWQGLIGQPNVFWGLEEALPGLWLLWGVWIGFFMALVGGVLGLVGGATV